MRHEIPLADLVGMHAEVAAEIHCELERLFAHGRYVGGREIAAFEQAFARFTGAERCIGVGSGTDAVELILRALGIGAGDEVLVPVNTFHATAAAVVRAGATPVFVDCDPEYLLLDVGQARARAGSRTRGVVAVHLYGQMAPMEKLAGLAQRGIHLIEDAAQAHGATRFGEGPGSVGSAAAWSFYPGKNLGAYGDAGAVVTRDAVLEKAIRLLGNYGCAGRDGHAQVGFNSRLDTLQAMVLTVKLNRLSHWNALRRQAALTYDALFAGCRKIRLPQVLPGNEHVYHQYVVRVPERDRVLRDLGRVSIEAGVHYRTPLHLQEAFAWLGHGPGDFPIAERAAGEILSLPIFPRIARAQQERVCRAVLESID